jgi:hypothetical protein
VSYRTEGVLLEATGRVAVSGGGRTTKFSGTTDADQFGNMELLMLISLVIVQ